MGTYPPRGALALYDPQPISDRPVGLGFPHRAGRCRPGGTPFSSPACRSCSCMKGFLIREWKPILPGVRWLLCTNPSQSATGQCGWGFHTVRGGFDPGGSPFSSPRCRSCRCMEGLLNRGWGPVLPVCGEMVGFHRGATPAASASPPDWPRADGRGALGQ